MIAYHLFCIFASILILLLYVSNYKKTYSIFFTIIQLLIPIVIVASYCTGMSNSLEEALILDNIVYIFMLYFFPLLFFAFLDSLNYKINKKILITIFVIQTILYVLIVRSNDTKLFFSNSGLQRIDEVAIVTKSYNPIFVVLNIYCSLYVISIFALLFYTGSKRSIFYSPNVIMVFIYFLIISIAYFIINVRNELIFVENFIEVVYQGIVVYIVNMFAYYNIDTYAINSDDNVVNSGVVVFDSKKNIIAYSKKILDWFPEFSNLTIGKRISSAIGVTTHFTHWLDMFEDDDSVSDIVKTDSISIRVYGSIKTFNRKKFYYFSLSNYTAEEKLLSIIGKDAEKITETFKQYLDPKLYSNIVNNSQISSSGKEMTVAVMFADIRNFTSITESIESDVIIKLLNTYLSLAENIIHKNGGILDKYIGDAVMAFWVDTGNGNAAYLAAKAALEIKEAVLKLEDNTYDEIYREIFFGIGLNYGKAILGNVGSDNLKNYTIIGDTVNTASRLENITPKNCIYITENFANIIKSSINIEKVNEYLRVKGKSNALTIYEVLSIKTNKYVETSESDIEDNTNKAILYICGVRGSYAVSGERFSKYGGDTTCFVIKQNKHAIVIDCGSGFSNAKPILNDCDRIDVLLTHLHYDHCIGLLNWSIFPKNVKPTFYGNFSKWNGEKSISDLFRPPFWPVDLFDGKIVNVTNEPIKLGDFNITFLDANHPNGAKVIYLASKKKRMMIMADAENSDNIDEEYLKKLDYLIYDGMYDDTEYLDHVGWGHSTWQAGVRVAQKYNVGQLIITHHSANSTDNILTQREEKAKIMYPRTMFAKIDERIVL